MTLNHHPDFPSARYYVLKLHRDADPEIGFLKGRVEHVASGQQFEFTSAAGLLALLLRHLQRETAAAARSNGPVAAEGVEYAALARQIRP